MERYSLANLPTKIEKLERLSNEVKANIYIKRDDQTGSEFSGNKVRKLEYLVTDALAKGCDMLITCGGIQSNHCRATVAVATKLGLKSAVLLRISEEPNVVGNYFLDKLMGGDVKFCTREEYSKQRTEIMESMAAEYAAQGYKPYIIPEGASNAIGSLGYYNCMQEIVEQERELGIKFDTIVIATGSGGTYTGLYVANELLKLNKRVIGMAVCDDTKYFTDIAEEISAEMLQYLPSEVTVTPLKRENIEINDKYVGIGYAISRPEELEFIKKIATMEGVVFDPVYTGKAIYGLYNELQDGGNIAQGSNILFIHTGGLYGLFPVSETFNWG
ncbi:MAG: D-cysteine desulfhydrase family protein [Bacteroidales bacterium]